MTSPPAAPKARSGEKADHAAPPRLALRDVAVAFRRGRGRETLSFSDLELAPGGRYLVEGASGRGKTTLLHLLGGLLSPVRGTVMVGDLPLSRLSDGERSRWRRRELGVIFQTLNLVEHLTPLENVLLGGPGTREHRERAEAVLGDLGLKDLGRAATATLSLGQRQRVAVARVIAARPRVILADEPTSSLDAINAAQVMEALAAAAARATMVVVSHDARLRPYFRHHLTIEDLVRGGREDP